MAAEISRKLGLISVVPSDHSVRVSKIPASADAMNSMVTMIGHADENRELNKHSNRSRTLSLMSSSSRIPKIFPSSEMHTSLDREIRSIDGKKCPLPAQKLSKNSKKAFANKEILLESQFKKIFPSMTFANEPLPPTGSQNSRQDQFLAFLSSQISSPSTPAGTTIAIDLPDEHQERPTSSASSISSVQKSVISIQSLPTNLEQIKTVSISISTFFFQFFS